MSRPGDNPFAAPTGDDRPEAGGECQIYRQGDDLLVEDRVDLPPGCVLCNAEAERWILLDQHMGEHFALIRKRWRIRYQLCDRHMRLLSLGRGLFLLLLLLLALSLWLAPAVHSGLVLGIGIGLLVLNAIIFKLITRQLSLGRVYRRHVALRGCGEAYLSRFPEAD